MEKDFSNLDGEVIDYEVVSGLSNIGDRQPDGDNFANAEGDYLDVPFSKFEGEFSNLFGLPGRKERARRRKIREGRKQQRIDLRGKRIATKQTAADAQKIASTSLTDKSGDIAMANALANSAPGADTPPSGMSTGAKVGIVVGVLALAVVGFIVYKKMHKK